MNNPFEKSEPPNSRYDPVELRKGIKVEHEHTRDRSIARRIAKDHLDEDPHYYRKLASLGLNPPVRPGPGLASEPGWIYHATNEERMAEIAVEGLKPHRPWEFTDQEEWPDGATEKRIYFSPKAEVVWQFAPEEGGAVILRVPQSAVAWRPEGTGDVYVTKRIPPERIQVLWDDGWRALSELVENP